MLYIYDHKKPPHPPVSFEECERRWRKQERIAVGLLIAVIALMLYLVSDTWWWRL